MNIKNLVDKLVKKYDTRDPFELAKAKNIIILEEDLGNIYGYSNTYKRQRFIHLNKKCPFKVQKLICAHELGYLLIHPKEEIHLVMDSTLKSKDDFERYAKLFVANLLITDEMLEKYAGEPAEKIAECEELPLDLIKVRINN